MSNKPRPAKLAEDHAARLVGNVTGLEVVKHDDGSKPSMYDLDIGSSIALEVTLLTAKTAEVNESEFAPFIGEHSANGLSASWVVWVHQSARVKIKRLDIISRILPQLRKLEERGISTIDEAECKGYPSWLHDPGCPVLKLYLDGVHTASRLPGEHPDGPHIIFSTIHGLGDYDRPGSLVEAIEQEFTEKEDLALKLNMSNRPEKHVFFWARMSRYRAFRALRLDELPQRDPQVPGGITAVWVGLFNQPQRAFFWSQASGWKRVGMSVR